MGDGKGRRGFDCAEKKYLSPVTSQQFDLTGASWSTPLTPSNHFLAARWFSECSYPVFNVLSSRPFPVPARSTIHSTSRPRIVEKKRENTWGRRWWEDVFPPRSFYLEGRGEISRCLAVRNACACTNASVQKRKKEKGGGRKKFLIP